MAVVYGISQAWKSVCARIPKEFPPCASPEELEQLLCSEREQRGRRPAEAAALVDRRQAELLTRIASLTARVAQVRAEPSRFR